MFRFNQPVGSGFLQVGNAIAKAAAEEQMREAQIRAQVANLSIQIDSWADNSRKLDENAISTYNALYSLAVKVAMASDDTFTANTVPGKIVRDGIADLIQLFNDTKTLVEKQAEAIQMASNGIYRDSLQDLLNQIRANTPHVMSRVQLLPGEQPNPSIVAINERADTIGRLTSPDFINRAMTADPLVTEQCNRLAAANAAHTQVAWIDALLFITKMDFPLLDQNGTAASSKKAALDHLTAWKNLSAQQ